MASGVVQEQATALGIEQIGSNADDLAQQLVDIEFRGHRLGHGQDVRLFALRSARAISELRGFKHDGGMRGKGLQQRAVSQGEITLALIQDLGYADHIAGAGTQRYAQDVVGVIAGRRIDRAIEAWISVGVVNNGGLAMGEHTTGDTGVGGKANLLDHLALRHARKQFAGLGVV